MQPSQMVEIIRQNSGLDFHPLLNRVQEGQQANDDLIQIKALANANT